MFCSLEASVCLRSGVVALCDDGLSKCRKLTIKVGMRVDLASPAEYSLNVVLLRQLMFCGLIERAHS